MIKLQEGEKWKKFTELELLQLHSVTLIVAKQGEFPAYVGKHINSIKATNKRTVQQLISGTENLLSILEYIQKQVS